MRISLGRDFLALRRGGVRASAGPLMVIGRANDCGHPRLGLAIARTAGGAVMRNAIKRRVREAFRLTWRQWPSPAQDQPSVKDSATAGKGTSGAGYDWLVSAKPHELLRVEEYQRLLMTAASEIDRTWRKKHQRR